MRIEDSQSITLRNQDDILKCYCGGKVVTSLSVSGSREMVCSKCGIVVPSMGKIPDSMVFGRGLLSCLVDGNSLGTNHTTRDSNGKNFLYEARSPNSNVFPDGPTLMPGHIANFEERDKDLSCMKHNVHRAFEKAGFKPVKMEYAARIILSIRKKCLSKRKPVHSAWYNDTLTMLNLMGADRKMEEMCKQIEHSVLDARTGKASLIL